MSFIESFYLLYLFKVSFIRCVRHMHSKDFHVLIHCLLIWDYNNSIKDMNNYINFILMHVCLSLYCTCGYDYVLLLVKCQMRDISSITECNVGMEFNIFITTW